MHVQRNDGSLLFHVLPQMRKAECLALTETIAGRVRRLLARRGVLADDAAPPSDETPSALDAWQAASLRNVVAFGPRAGRPLRKIVLPLPPRIDRDRVGVDLLGRPANGRRDAQRFDLDVEPFIAATDRTTPSAVKAILECLGLPARPPPLAAAREREQGELGFDG